MSGLWKTLEWVMDKMKTIGAASLVVMTLLTCVDVVGRYFKHPVFGSIELTGYLAVLAVAMAMPYTHHMKGHIGVEILVRSFARKTQRIIDFCTTLLSLGLFAIISWRMAIYAGTMRRSGEVSMNLQFPEYVVIYVVAFCFVIFTLIILQDVLRIFGQLRKS